MEAYQILQRQNLLQCQCDFTEELPYADTIFSEGGRQKLYTRLCELSARDFVGIFVCDPLTITIGCHYDHPFVIDTHPVSMTPGNGNCLLLIGKRNTLEIWKNICKWLWKRLHHGGVKANRLQSLAVMSRQCVQEQKKFKCKVEPTSLKKRAREDDNEIIILDSDDSSADEIFHQNQDEQVSQQKRARVGLNDKASTVFDSDKNVEETFVQ
ncbi:uncharacterized protein LOC117111983, partial [Anneissia japonica]|uniref:uncharacterized protein LOC117111983 n=1 Tax=Anneissia japonica TaxID=1529436 RepID=UPI00142582B1